MVWQIISVNTNAFVNLTTADSVTVMAGVNLSNSTGTAINSDGGNQQAFIYGMVASNGTAVYLGFSTTSNYAYIGAAGALVGGSTGITLSGSAHKIRNYGDISSGGDGVFMVGSGDSNRVINYGSINGTDTAITNSGIGTGIVTTSNFGTITGGRAAYDASFGSSSDYIFNSGTITGDVLLGGGSDLFQNKGAGTVDGTVFGGTGADNFYLGAGSDVIYGGSEQDFLVFTKEAGIKIALDSSFENTGVAKGDYIREVEGVYGSNLGSDYIVGDAQANVFYGFGGTDTLYGGSNADTLAGGAGKDVLYGGTGNDVFFFYTLSEGGDKISTFSNTASDNDSFQISYEELAIAGIIGPRALLASEFYKGSTNICTGAEDRIILRTTDNTVWFDSNGKASGGLTMLADLQSGVTLTFADFSFV